MARGRAKNVVIVAHSKGGVFLLQRVSLLICVQRDRAKNATVSHI